MKRLLLLIFISSNLFSFSTTNIQYLYGTFDDNSYVYDTKDGGKSTITIENYTSFEYGDVFMFIDYAIADDRFKYHDEDKNEAYGEFSPRLSLSKLSSSDLSFSFVKDIYLAAQYNRGEDYTAYLYGIGSDLDILGFNVFGLNGYIKNQDIGENTLQLSANYTSKTIYNIFHITGFTDWTEYDLLSQNQFLFEIAKPFKTHNLYLGVEWHYYLQKKLDINFNTRVRSSTFQAMIKYSW
jgi:nucleoside-specific outer membrane channel protein Tsx